MGALNRVGREAPWNVGHFFGNSYFCNPRGTILVEGNTEKDEVVTDPDLDMIREVREYWAFYRDRRPEIYGVVSDCSK